MTGDIFLALDKDYTRKLFKNKRLIYFPERPNPSIKEIVIEKKSPDWAKETCLARYAVFFDDGFKKVVRGASAKNISKKSAWMIMRHLFEENLTVARPIDFVEDINLLLYEEVSGLPLSLMFQNQKTDIIAGYLKMAALWLADLHKIKIEDKNFNPAIFLDAGQFNRVFKKISQMMPLIKGLLPAKSQIEFVGKFSGENKVLIHNDFFPGNIIVSGGKIYGIDFDKSGLGFRLNDVAAILIWLEMSGKIWQSDIKHSDIDNLKDIFLKTYCQAVGMRHLEAQDRLRPFLIRVCWEQAANYLELCAKVWGTLPLIGKRNYEKKIELFLKQAKNYLL